MVATNCPQKSANISQYKHQRVTIRLDGKGAKFYMDLLKKTDFLTDRIQIIIVQGKKKKGVKCKLQFSKTEEQLASFSSNTTSQSRKFENQGFKEKQHNVKGQFMADLCFADHLLIRHNVLQYDICIDNYFY